MHRIIKAHLDSFAKHFGLEAEDEEVQFEKFANYAVISARFSASYDIDDVTTGPSEDGTDGIAVVIDEEVSVSLEDAETVFGRTGETTTLILFSFRQNDQNLST